MHSADSGTRPISIAKALAEGVALLGVFLLVAGYSIEAGYTDIFGIPVMDVETSALLALAGEFLVDAVARVGLFALLILVVYFVACGVRILARPWKRSARSRASPRARKSLFSVTLGKALTSPRRLFLVVFLIACAKASLLAVPLYSYGHLLTKQARETPSAIERRPTFSYLSAFVDCAQAIDRQTVMFTPLAPDGTRVESREAAGRCARIPAGVRAIIPAGVRDYLYWFEIIVDFALVAGACACVVARRYNEKIVVATLALALWLTHSMSYAYAKLVKSTVSPEVTVYGDHSSLTPIAVNSHSTKALSPVHRQAAPTGGSGFLVHVNQRSIFLVRFPGVECKNGNAIEIAVYSRDSVVLLQTRARRAEDVVYKIISEPPCISATLKKGD